MAFPTKHWAALIGNLGIGASGPVAHGLRDGRNGALITPDIMHPILESALGFGPIQNANVQPYQTWDTTNVYLSNYDSTSAHSYHVLVRAYYSDDDANF